MRRNRDIAILFSQSLRIGLLSKYRKIPSSGYIAKEFNLRAKNTGTVTSETVRRWLHGLALPDIEKIVALSEWLEIDLNTLLSIRKAAGYHSNKIGNGELNTLINSSQKLIQSLHEISAELEDLVQKLKPKIPSSF